MLRKSNYKFELLITCLLFCLSISAQDDGTVKKYYISKDGVKTQIVYEPFSPDSEKSKFLYEKIEDVDRSTRYDRLKDAIEETNSIEKKIDTIRRISSSSDGVFSVEGSKKNLELLNKEKNLDRRSAGSSLEEMVFLMEKYGDVPSFFINEIPVPLEVYNRVLDKEVVSKDFFVQNTISGNPNGEIRIKVSDKTMKRLGIDQPVSEGGTKVESYAFDSSAKKKDATLLPNMKIEETPKSEKAGENTDLDELLKRIKQLESKTSGVLAEPSRKVYTDSPKKQEIVYSYDDIREKSIQPTQNKTNVSDEEVFVVRKSDWKKEEIPLEDTETKRSVRDIKDRERIKK